MTFGKPLSWNGLADQFDSHTGPGGRRARTLPLEAVFKWAERRKDLFFICPEKGTVHLLDIAQTPRQRRGK